MTAEVIDKTHFLHHSHADGMCSVTVSEVNESNDSEEITKELETFDDIHLIKIKLKSKIT